jgi:hypothetical protein
MRSGVCLLDSIPVLLRLGVVAGLDDVVFEQYGNNLPDVGYDLGECLRGVVTSLKTKKGALVDGLEGRKSLELITALYQLGLAS